MSLNYYTKQVQFNDQNDSVLFLQRMLHIVDCDPGDLDGDFGNATLAATKEFQNDYGLDADGICGVLTWHKLYDRVATIQQALNVFGCNVTVDGNVGSSGMTTVNALLYVQRAKGLTQDWICGPATSKALNIDYISKDLEFVATTSNTAKVVQTEDSGRLDGLLFYISPGHGGSDSGAVGNGLKESDIVLDLGFKVGALLQAHGAKVMLGRTGNYYKSLVSRTSEANAAKADYYISIHENAAESTQANGTEVWYAPGSTTGGALATSVCNNIVKALGSTNRGAKAGDLWEVQQSNMTAILSEGLFITNSGNASLMDSDDDKYRQALAITNGIVEYLA